MQKRTMPIRITPVEEDLACAVIIESTTRIFLPLKFVAGNELFFKFKTREHPEPRRTPRARRHYETPADNNPYCFS